MQRSIAIAAKHSTHHPDFNNSKSSTRARTVGHRCVAPIKAARRSSQERQAEIRRNDAATAAKVWRYAVEARDMEAARLAIKLESSVASENQFTAVDFEKDGELYQTSGQLIVPPTRLSQAYLRRQGARARRSIMATLSDYRLLVGHMFRFYTLTMPNFGADYETTLNIIQDALVRFKRSSIWRENVSGAFDKIEWTFGKLLTPHNHFHAHILAAARRVDLKGFSATWTRCVRASAASHGVEWQLPDDRTLSVKLETKSVPEMISEITKYIAKPSDYNRLSGAELVKIHHVLRGRRLLNSYGTFNANKGKVKQSATKETDVARAMPNLDTGTQLNTFDIQAKHRKAALNADPSVESSATEAWSVERLEEWRRDYALQFHRQRERRLVWLQQHHLRCKIVLGDGQTRRGAARLELVE
jgi:hypothetical protein